MPEGEFQQFCVETTAFFRLRCQLILTEFAEAVGGVVARLWNPRQCAPALPIEISDLCRLLSKPECRGGRKGRNQGLRHWAAYWAWDYESVDTDLTTLVEIRNLLSHEAVRVGHGEVDRLAGAVRRVMQALGLPTTGDRLESPPPAAADAAAAAAAAAVVTVRAGGGAGRLSVSHGERAFVGRSAELQGLAEALTAAEARGEASRIAVTGPSGIGKTAVALKICEALREKLPFQVAEDGGVV